MKKTLSTKIAAMVKKVAVKSAGACSMFGPYQPKTPKALLKK